LLEVEAMEEASFLPADHNDHEDNNQDNKKINIVGADDFETLARDAFADLPKRVNGEIRTREAHVGEIARRKQAERWLSEVSEHIAGVQARTELALHCYLELVHQHDVAYARIQARRDGNDHVIAGYATSTKRLGKKAKNDWMRRRGRAKELDAEVELILGQIRRALQNYGADVICCCCKLARCYAGKALGCAEADGTEHRKQMNLWARQACTFLENLRRTGLPCQLKLGALFGDHVIREVPWLKEYLQPAGVTVY